MDIKGKISEIADKVRTDPEIKSLFAKDPVKAVEKLIGVDLPDDVIKNIIDGVKAKVSLDKAGDLLGGIKKLF